MKSRAFVAALAIAVTTVAGCGGPSGLYPVSGTVLVNGEPAVGATVTFVKKGATAPTDQTPQGVVHEDGTFTLAGPAGDGAAPGEYAVLVEWKEGAGKRKGHSPGLTAPDRLKKKYLSIDKPLLSATVEAKSNALPPFELK